MARRGTVNRKPAKKRQRKLIRPKRRTARTARRRSGSSLVDLHEQVTFLSRELAEARVAMLISTYAGGHDSAWRWTYWGWKRKAEWVETACAKRAV